jgi:hypothetical protein
MSTTRERFLAMDPRHARIYSARNALRKPLKDAKMQAMENAMRSPSKDWPSREIKWADLVGSAASTMRTKATSAASAKEYMKSKDRNMTQLAAAKRKPLKK